MSEFKPKEIATIAAVIGLVLLFFYGMGSALLPLMMSFVMAYASYPIVRKLEKRNYKRHHATLIVLGGLTVALILALLVVVPPIVSEMRDAIAAAPQTMSSALTKIDTILSEYGIHVPYDRDSLQAFIGEYSEKISSDVVATCMQFIKNAVSNLASVIVFLLSFAMVPVFYFYVINDFEKIQKVVKSIVPKFLQNESEELVSRTDTILSGYIRGQMLVCTILSVLYTAALFAVGVKYALVIGVATGFLSIIPYIGYSLGFAMAVLSVLANHDGWGTLMALVITYSVVQFLESFIITPKIVGDQVGLTPFEAILALIIFGNLFGFIGLFLAIPIGGIVKLLIRMLFAAYKRTEFYRS